MEPICSAVVKKTMWSLHSEWELAFTLHYCSVVTWYMKYLGSLKSEISYRLLISATLYYKLLLSSLALHIALLFMYTTLHLNQHHWAEIFFSRPFQSACRSCKYVWICYGSAALNTQQINNIKYSRHSRIEYCFTMWHTTKGHYYPTVLFRIFFFLCFTIL